MGSVPFPLYPISTAKEEQKYEKNRASQYEDGQDYFCGDTDMLKWKVIAGKGQFKEIQFEKMKTK